MIGHRQENLLNVIQESTGGFTSVRVQALILYIQLWVQLTSQVANLWSHRKCRRGYEDNIKMDLKEMDKWVWTAFIWLRIMTRGELS